MSKTRFGIFWAITQESQDIWKFWSNIWIPWLILHKIYMNKIFSSFLVKQINSKNMTVPVLPYLNDEIKCWILDFSWCIRVFYGFTRRSITRKPNLSQVIRVQTIPRFMWQPFLMEKGVFVLSLLLESWFYDILLVILSGKGG